jgi:CheY-like chemotaxis protein
MEEGMTARVLYAEDREITREWVAPILRELGADVVEFGVLNKAKAAFTRGKFDAVILDGKLQEYDDGWKWAAELCTQGVRVMVHSSSCPPADSPVDLIFLDKSASTQETRNCFTLFLSRR